MSAFLIAFCSFADGPFQRSSISFVLSVFHQLDADEEPLATHVADRRVALRHGP